jgi:uncharacterized protein YciI
MVTIKRLANYFVAGTREEHNDQLVAIKCVKLVFVGPHLLKDGSFSKI